MQTGFAGPVFIIYPGARLNGYDKKYCLKKIPRRQTVSVV